MLLGRIVAGMLHSEELALCRQRNCLEAVVGRSALRSILPRLKAAESVLSATQGVATQPEELHAFG